MKPTAIDLNADLGEGMASDAGLLALVSSANVSCGAHAGEPAGIAATLAEAARRGVVVGAHPSWPDRAGFGRVERVASRLEVERLIREQVAVLRAIAGPIGVSVAYLKPHGALYNQAMRDDAEIVAGLLAAAEGLGLPLMGQPGMPIEGLARQAGVVYLREGFPDRGYRDDGRLVPRGQPGALIEGVDGVVRQALALLGRGVDSLCLHGDSDDAVARAVAIRQALGREGVEVRSPFASMP